MRRVFLTLLVTAAFMIVATAQAAIHQFPAPGTPSAVVEQIESNCPYDGSSESPPYQEKCVFYYDDSDNTFWQETNKRENLQKELTIVLGKKYPADREAGFLP